MSAAKTVALWALIVAGFTSIAGCVVQERRDGGVTVRPMHVE